jgi:hypothetical protein
MTGSVVSSVAAAPWLPGSCVGVVVSMSAIIHGHDGMGHASRLLEKEALRTFLWVGIAHKSIVHSQERGFQRFGRKRCRNLCCQNGGFGRISAKERFLL